MFSPDHTKNEVLNITYEHQYYEDTFEWKPQGNIYSSNKKIEQP